ncbi:hypothetical protein BFW87_17710 [Pseudomonas fluorescens]|uniref:Uncharacterized protein n=1 Tax=Pseudomonas fluorescens TaxID=294 RepID=A0A1T2YKI2_PSEFL|nr:hypothetical protein BFW87_17710 [Pseudomonas fluorescens]
MCGSWLACDADTSVFQPDRGDAIAGKPAPTVITDSQIFQKSRPGRCDDPRLFGAPHHDACSPIHPRFPSVRRSESR